MVKRLLRRFSAYRTELAKLQKQAESDAALIESQSRYIEALEGRDEERVRRINELECVCVERLARIMKLEGKA